MFRQLFVLKCLRSQSDHIFVIIKYMCEFNRPYPVPFGQHPDDIHGRPEIIVRTPEAWARRQAELPPAEVSMISQAEQDAAAIGCDVHLYRKIGSSFIGLALEPGTGPNVKIWEH